MTDLQNIIDTLDNAADSFDSIASKEQKKIYDEVLILAKDIETDASGKVKQSISNLKRLTKIKAHLSALSKDKEWVAGISQFAKYFGILQKQQNAYFYEHFPELTLSETAKKKHELQKQIAVQNTMDALMGSGLKANVTDKLNDILLRAVTSGAKFADLQEELREHLLGKDGGQGAFARYATTYATTALSQFTGQNNKLLTDDLGTEWFMYVGSNKETTRHFCEACTRKKYIHRSEIHTLLTGHIHIAGGEDVEVPIYAKTGLPYGMIEGTTEENFQINVGGWNCRHQLVPVADAVVPKNIREDIEKQNNQQKQQEKIKQNNNDEIQQVIDLLNISDIEYIDVQQLKENYTQEQIIHRIGGGDKTKGSCSSLAFAYAGNKAGYNVIDFRGGKSCDFFSKTINIKKIVLSSGGKFARNYSDYKNAEELLKDVEVGKEYYFTCGKHAAIVRKTGTMYEYLELQSESDNGFKKLTYKELKDRFGAKKSHSLYGSKVYADDCIIDIELLKNNPKFKNVLGFINTYDTNQQKGIGGKIR